MKGLVLIVLAALMTVSPWLPARAQDSARTPRIGFLSHSAPNWARDALREGLRDIGYIEGQNILIEYRWAQGQFDRLPDLAKELVDLNVAMIVASVTPAALAAKAATTRIPIVMVGVADPTGVGLVASLARPGGNVTGTSSMAVEIVGKQLELLREIVPKASRAAVLWNPANPEFQTLQMRELEAAAVRSEVQLHRIEARKADDFEAAFATIVQADLKILLVLIDNLFSLHAEKLAELALKRGLIMVSGTRAFAEAGALATYGPNHFLVHKRAALYVDRILKGAKPGESPIEQPTLIEVVVNLKTARALGVTVPQSILARADEVIE